MTSLIASAPRMEAASQELVDPFGNDLTRILNASKLVEDAIKNGVTRSRLGELRVGPVLEIADWLNPMHPMPVNNLTGLISINPQYVRDNRRTRTDLEKRGLPGIMITRAPLNDAIIARRTDGTEADYTAQQFLRARAALNVLNETQFQLVNNDVFATINKVFETSQLLAANESSAAASGFILLANLRIQVLTVSIRHVHYMTGVLAEAAKPQTTIKGLMHILGLIETGLHREALIHRQPLDWISTDAMFSIAAAFGKHAEAIPMTSPRLRQQMVEAVGKVEGIIAEGPVNFGTLRSIFTEAHRKADNAPMFISGAVPQNAPAAEVVFTAHERVQDGRSARPEKARANYNAFSGKKGQWQKRGGQRYYSPPDSKKREVRNDQRQDNRKQAKESPDDETTLSKQELLAELKKLRLQLGEKRSRDERTQSAFMAHDDSDSEPEEAALAAVQHHSKKLRKKDTWTRVPPGRAFMAVEVLETKVPLPVQVMQDLPEYDFGPAGDQTSPTEDKQEVPESRECTDAHPSPPKVILQALNTDLRRVQRNHKNAKLRMTYIKETMGRLCDLGSILLRELDISLPGETDRHDYFYLPSQVEKTEEYYRNICQRIYNPGKTFTSMGPRTMVPCHQMFNREYCRDVVRAICKMPIYTGDPAFDDEISTLDEYDQRNYPQEDI